MVDLKTLKQLIKLMVDNDLTELDIQAEGGPVKLKRHSQGAGGAEQAVPVAVPALQPAAAPAAPAQAAAAGPDAPGTEDAGTVTIDSPMVGTFYTASSPDAKAFANVGDRVDPDAVVCIVEAMKVFNEIKAEVSGTIEKVLIENGQAVEFGQPLFTVRPD
jgi:acetyl-CoA carboxylase biotin carboxyl carrier protein